MPINGNNTDLKRSPMTVQWNDLIVRDARALTASEIRDLLKVADRPEIISFAGGVPDPSLFPLAEKPSIFH